MICKDNTHSVLDNMILSASGWRGIFSICGEESAAKEIHEAYRVIVGAAAFVIAKYTRNFRKEPLVLLGSDTRPTGPAIANVIIPVLLASGCCVRYAGVTAAPEIMAWARNSTADSFIYISASHNPIGHNGLKFGMSDGGVLSPGETAKLTADLRSFLDKDDCAEEIEFFIQSADPVSLEKVYAGMEAAKAESYKAYYDFCGEVAWNSNAGASTSSADIAATVKQGLEKCKLGVVCDFNGSARTVSIDRIFFTSLGLRFDSINGKPGEIAHRIVPEGESLEPCRLLLEKAHERDASFVLGYTPDCDGDRGNLVIWDDTLGKARSLEAQEVFALACVAEFSHLVWTGCHDIGRSLSKTAVAVNDPTSMRIDRIAEAFGIEVFRAEVGEANVVGLARKLREKGFIVRILGEGSAGGNITHPSAVRDPIHTVLALVKMLTVRSSAAQPGLFEIWCRLSGQLEMYRDNFGLADIIASLPPFVTTPAYSEDAVLRISTKEHSQLKNRYQEVFLREWEGRKDTLKAQYGIYSWEAIAYNGMEEKRDLSRFGDAGNGGLKIIFHNDKGRAIAAIWMRGSATEPVFRIMADVEGSDKEFERDLIEWQRRMVQEADKRSE
ncbi:MAG: phosphatidylglycerol lysyltransferase [Treponema sp.]|jgi:phosphoglucomutase|nr:phosphatidylglycerol lysyltransferase [Treponema sp.]